MSKQTLDRKTFTLSREIEYFTEKELGMQIGLEKELWPIALGRELIDNALDACEVEYINPEVSLKIAENDFAYEYFEVSDNGPGISENTIAGSLDYFKRVSDKMFYVSPTRGQIGNALKVIWATPFVVDGEKGKVEIRSKGKHHIITVTMDRVANKPKIDHTIEKDQLIKNGTSVLVYMNFSDILEDYDKRDFYKHCDKLIKEYSAFNPHAKFNFDSKLGQVTNVIYEPTNLDWKKWRTDNPTSPCWYNYESFRSLFAANVEIDPNRSIRDFIREFRGLAGIKAQKQVLCDDFIGKHLNDFVINSNVRDMKNSELQKLLERMKEITKPVKPRALGAIGEEHLKNWAVNYANIVPESVKYKKKYDDDFYRPRIIEVLFGVNKDDDAGLQREYGLNWSPVFKSPSTEIESIIRAQRIDDSDPLLLLLHVATPRFDFADRGKSRVVL